MSWLDTLGQIAQVVKDVSDVYKSTVAQVYQRIFDDLLKIYKFYSEQISLGI